MAAPRLPRVSGEILGEAFTLLCDDTPIIVSSSDTRDQDSLDIIQDGVNRGPVPHPPGVVRPLRLSAAATGTGNWREGSALAMGAFYQSAEGTD
jgi:hypothetical protein